MAFRGVGKSWVTSAFVVWLLYMHPNIRILVVSASGTRAKAFTTFTLPLDQRDPTLRATTAGSEQGGPIVYRGLRRPPG